jgi:hypothetical protein
MNDKRSAVLLAILLATALPAFAQQPPGGPAPAEGAAPSAPASRVPWSSLSPDQQRLLSRYGANQWSNLPPEKQQALAHGSQRWLGMSDEQKGLATQRYERWHSLPPDQREQLRQRWQRFQSLPPNQQESVRQNYRRFQQLPPEQRKALHEQWRNATPAQRQEMLQRGREMRMRRMQQHPPPRMQMPHAPSRPPR